ncbi:MAG: 2-succinyl-5-enolpyruvyl-6-hydroxy-3-cyclohexene-1-carboxylic-acid synthase [Candidatus Planktophila sp.]|nr:2-succinyl-5-enolpyruvyl-6-hydroxy-3-cyclohexene-1-carboxylic-acid synthase [Candidatus Planktophila sp.]
MNASTSLARVIVRQIIEAGITDVVISPGSRNAPLSLAFNAAAARGLITIHIRIDERTAAFFALGLVKSTGRAVPVVCTSGTAVANYHPAVLEANHTNAALLVLTADRPAMLRRTGANQTTEQARIFGKAVRYFADIDGPVFPMELPLDSLRFGPVHLNLQFDEPLLPDDSTQWLDEIKLAPITFKARKKTAALKLQANRGVLVIGHDRGGLSVEAVTKFAKKLNWPIIAEDPLSFPDAIAHASIFLTSPAVRSVLAAQVAIVIGRTTLSRSVNALIGLAPVTYVIDPRIATVDGDRAADKRFTEVPTLDCVMASDDWIAQWRKYSQRCAKLITEIAGWNEASIAKEIAAAIPDGSALFVSSSRPIRDLEGFATPRSGITTYANRGLAGIDGNISTALGVASGHVQTFAVLGDLAFLHDITGLITHEDINCRFIVINNDGGGIFSTLPQRGVEGFETVFGTPHGLDLATIALSFGIPASTITTIAQLKKVFSAPVKGISVVVAKVQSREANADTLKAIYEKMNSI